MRRCQWLWTVVLGISWAARAAEPVKDLTSLDESTLRMRAAALEENLWEMPVGWPSVAKAGAITGFSVAALTPAWLIGMAADSVILSLVSVGGGIHTSTAVAPNFTVPIVTSAVAFGVGVVSTVAGLETAHQRERNKEAVRADYLRIEGELIRRAEARGVRLGEARMNQPLEPARGATAAPAATAPLLDAPLRHPLVPPLDLRVRHEVSDGRRPGLHGVPFAGLLPNGALQQIRRGAESVHLGPAWRGLRSLDGPKGVEP